MLLCWCRLRAGLLVVLMVIGAQVVPTPAVAGDDLFEVLDVRVDETDQTAAAARDKALAIGERRAWDMLVQRLVDPTQKAPLPEYSNADIGDAVKDFWVSEEKTSPVRYIATLNYNFRPDKVRRLLSRRGVRFSTTPSPPVVIIPVYDADGSLRLWDDPNPWREAWRAVRARGMVPIRLPVGDLLDLSMLSATAAVAGDGAGLAQVQERHGAGAALVTVAKVEGEGKARQLKVTSVRHGSGLAQPLGERTYPVEGSQPSAELLQQAALASAQELEIGWRRGTTVSAPRPSSATNIVVPTGSLEEWVRLRHQLESLPQIERMQVQSLQRQQTRVTIVYAGGTEQLTTALAQQGFALRSENGGWVLIPASGATVPARQVEP